MARLRVRIELNRRMSGVPLDKMASVVEETRKFFFLLAEDVHIDAERGEWLASDFDAESLNFTAEYGGPVSTEQVQAFGAAFSGATSLRRATIAQFTRIAEFLGEDELVGFGLYQSDQEPEPTEWRCLSKRDAMRFGEEIKLLAEAAGEQSSETQLPAVMNGSIAGRRLFKDRREREALAADPSKVVRELESNLSRRIGLLEGEVAEQTRRLQQVGSRPDLAEERFREAFGRDGNFLGARSPPVSAIASSPSACSGDAARSGNGAGSRSGALSPNCAGLRSVARPGTAACRDGSGRSGSAARGSIASCRSSACGRSAACPGNTAHGRNAARSRSSACFQSASCSNPNVRADRSPQRTPRLVSARRDHSLRRGDPARSRLSRDAAAVDALCVRRSAADW